MGRLRGCAASRNRQVEARRTPTEDGGQSLQHAAANDVRDVNVVEESLHDELAEFAYRRLRRRPMILTVVVEV
jgi:mRNA degradation ribonuclease J1/J2